jgi:MoaA/NifB/PqqE/SkfB family radical SAM enzyme
MCDIYQNKPVDIEFSKATQILDFMAENGFLIAYFTGGEPSLHPDIVKMVKYANTRGLFTSLTTNGTISSETLKELSRAGLQTLSVSVDSWDSALCEAIRNFKGIQERVKKTVTLAKKLGLGVYSLTYLGSHITPENIEKMVKYVNNTLGIPFALCYPATINETTYLLGKKVPSPSFDAIKAIAEKLLNLKKQGYRIANMATYLEEVINFDGVKPSKYPCKCGEYVFYIDWLGDVYPCFKRKKMFNILQEGSFKPNNMFLKNVNCNKCLIDCFREPSYLAYIHSPRLLLRELRTRFPLHFLL